MQQDEVREHNDIIMVRGRDSYHNLPNKTLRALLWAMAAAPSYSHFLKTDDDCYVRMDNVFRSIQVKLPTDWLLQLPCLHFQCLN